MLWPIAWLWAYTKPVLHQLAYGVDKVPHGQPDEAHASPAREADKKDEKQNAPDEVNQLRQRIAELETKLAGTAVAQSGKV
jgi:uncharacterized protein YlxW (UPF0749 family)